MAKKFLFLFVAAIAAAGCNRKQEASPWVALVTLDGGLSNEALQSAMPGARVYGNAFTTAPLTLPAAASVLTGLAPQAHGIRVNGAGALAAGTPTVASVLSARGYECAAFLSSYALASIHGLTNGFAKYDARMTVGSSQEYWNRPAAHVVDSAAAWLKEREARGQGQAQGGGKPAFVWIHVRSDENAVREIARFFSLLPRSARKAVVPLHNNSEEPFRCFSIDDSVAKVVVTVSEPFHAAREDEAFSITAIKAFLAGENPIASASALASLSAVPAAPVVENFMPWHAFRMPPLASDPAAVSHAAVVPAAQATLAEIAFLRANGHVGDGLLPPFTNGVAVSELSREDRAFLVRAFAALAFDAGSSNSLTNAAAAMAELAAERPGAPVFHSRLGDILFKEKKYIEAYGAYSRAAELGINMVYDTRRQSLCHAAVGNIGPAVDRAENAFLMNANDPALRRELAGMLFNVGGALMSQQRYREAGEFLTRVNWLEPRNPDGLVALAQLQLGLGQTNNAAGYLREAIKIRPNDKRAAAVLKAIGK